MNSVIEKKVHLHNPSDQCYMFYMCSVSLSLSSPHFTTEVIFKPSFTVNFSPYAYRIEFFYIETYLFIYAVQ